MIVAQDKALKAEKKAARKRARAERRALRNLPAFATEAVKAAALELIPGKAKRAKALKTVATALDKALGGEDGENWRGLWRVVPMEAITDLVLEVFRGRIEEAVDKAYDRHIAEGGV